MAALDLVLQQVVASQGSLEQNLKLGQVLFIDEGEAMSNHLACPPTKHPLSRGVP